MTWVRLGDQYGDELAVIGLSDGAFRLHTEAICWVCRLEAMDCRLPKHLLSRLAGGADPEQAAKELVASGCWEDGGDHWVIHHHAETIRQGLGAQRAKRERDREAQQRTRARAAAKAVLSADDIAALSHDVSADVSADVSHDVSDGISADVNATLTTYLTTELQQQREGSQPEFPATCKGCDKPARRGCSTCWEHAYLEPV